MEVINQLWLLAQRILRHWIRGKEIFGYLLAPIFWLLLFGNSFELTSKLPGFPTTSYAEFITPSVIAMTILFTVGPGASCIVADKMLGFFNRLLALPISRITIALGYVLQLIIKCLILVWILFGLAFLIGVKPATGVPGLLLITGLSFLLGLGFSGISLFIASKSSRPGMFFGLMNLFVMPVLFLAPSFFPKDVMPEWLQTASGWNPVTYFIEPVRKLIISGYDWSSLGKGVFVLLVFNVITISILLYSFSKERAT